MGLNLPGLPTFGSEKTTIISGNKQTTETTTKLDPLGLFTTTDKETVINQNQPQASGGPTINIGQLNINSNNNNVNGGQNQANGMMQLFCQMMQLLQTMSSQSGNTQATATATAGNGQNSAFAFAGAGAFVA